MRIKNETYRRLLNLLGRQQAIIQLCTEVQNEISCDVRAILRELMEQPNDFGFDDEINDANNKKEEK